MVVVDVLGHERTRCLGCVAILRELQTVFLELEDLNVTSIWLALGLEFKKVIVPLPDGFRVLLKEFFGQDVLGIAHAGILSFPEAIFASECRNAAGCTQASACQN